MRNVRKCCLATFVAGSALLAMSGVQASDATVTFKGKVTNNSCSVKVGASVDPVIEFATVTVSDVEDGTNLTQEDISLKLTGCSSMNGAPTVRFAVGSEGVTDKLFNTGIPGVGIKVLQGHTSAEYTPGTATETLTVDTVGSEYSLAMTAELAKISSTPVEAGDFDNVTTELTVIYK